MIAIYVYERHEQDSTSAPSVNQNFQINWEKSRTF